MSRAFVNEDSNGPEPRYVLPDYEDPGYEEAAASALLEGANVGDSLSAEEATGYRWGEPALRPHVRRLLERFREAGDERMVTLAERFLKAR